MKKAIFIILFNVLTFSLIAQSYIRLNNFWEKTYIVNPASVNYQYQAEFDLLARKQWINFPGSPTTLYFSGTTYLDDINTQLGLKVLKDQIGYTSTSTVDLSYAYSLKLDREWRMNFGLGLSYQGISYDLSKVNSPTPGDPTVYMNLLNSSNVNSDLGFELTNKDWRLGVASQNLFSLFLPINKLFINTNYLYTQYRQHTQNPLNLGFGLCGIQYGNFYQGELNFNTYIKANPESNGFRLGLFYRTWSEFGVLFGIELTHNLQLSYSYDYNVSGISTNSFGSHELMLTFLIDKEFKCQNCWY
ncbi:MAG: PorP/SprF family type IX secretion system membrane protein [Paludibacter sp.]|nr:PorP/SprF family type IX secretion system membrane protein [Paludibacter sp.]